MHVREVVSSPTFSHKCAVKHVPDWFPGAGFKRTAKEWAKITEAAAEGPFQHVKDEMVSI